MSAMKTPGWAVWFVGLPGSGKSTVARTVANRLKGLGLSPVMLVMDRLRKSWFPVPTYSLDERAAAYRLLAAEAAKLVRQGDIVLLDGTAHELTVRRAIRQDVSRFAEIYVRCPLEVAMQREASRPNGAVMTGLYRKALDRKAGLGDYPGLGPVIGVDVAFEVDPQAEVVLDSDHLAPDEAADRVLRFLRSRGWVD